MPEITVFTDNRYSIKVWSNPIPASLILISQDDDDIIELACTDIERIIEIAEKHGIIKKEK